MDCFAFAPKIIGINLNTISRNYYEKEAFLRERTRAEAVIMNSSVDRRICTVLTSSVSPLQGHDLSADYWSLGILIFELLTGR